MTAITPRDSSRRSKFDHGRASLDVLVVDDEENARRGLEAVLRGLDHSCRLATDGAEALEMHEAQRADVILSDWDMDRMTGEELCRRVRSSGEGDRYTYFIMMTAFEDPEHVLRGMAAGADDYQTKPVDVVALEGHLLSAARVIALQGKMVVSARAIAMGTDVMNPASLVGTVMRVRVSEDLGTFFANAKRYKRKCCAAMIAVEPVAAIATSARARVFGDAANVARFALRHGDAFFRESEAEMLIVMPEQALTDATRAIARIRARLGALGLTSHAGLAQVEPFDGNADDWIRRSRRALARSMIRGESISIDA